MKILDGSKVGIQSWCFRGLEGNEAVVKALKELGIDGIELCGIHVDVNNTQNVDEVINLYNSNGITITSFGIDDYPNNEKALRPKFEFAMKAGFKFLGIDPEPDAYMLIDRLCSEYGIKTAVHNHGRDHRFGYTKQLDDIFSRVSDNIGLCLDTAWALDAGEDPVAMIGRYSGRLYGIHFKDFNFDSENNPQEAVLGTGRLDLNGVFKALEKAGFKGYATIEYEGDVEDPAPSIGKCIKELRKYEHKG